MLADKLNGLACLVYVAQRHGIDTSSETLERRYGHLGSEISPQVLLSIAGDLGLSARILDIKWDDLKRFSRLLPAILPLQDGTSVILQAIGISSDSGMIVTIASAQGEGPSELVVGEQQLSAVWAGKLILLKRKYRLDDESRPFSLAWIASQVLRERKLFRDIAISSLFSTAFAIAPAFITMIVIDKVIVNRSVSTLIVIGFALVIMIIFEMTLGYLRRVLMQVTATRIDGRLNLYILSQLLRLPMDYFERTPTGFTLGRLAQVGRIRNFLTGQLFGTFLEMITLVGLVPALLILNWALALFVFASAGAIFAIIYIYITPMARLHAVVTKTEREKGAFLTETVYGMRAIKSLALEDRRRGEWDVKVAGNILAQYKYGALSNYPQTFVVPFERLMFSGSIILGAAASLASPTSIYPGALIAFSMLAGRTAHPLVQLARLMSDIGEIRSAVGEVAAVMNEPPEDLRAGSGLRLPVYGRIGFSGVNFRYNPQAPLALADVSFTIEPGAIFGIMGRSGSGKTTITRILQGLSANYEGTVKIDGMDLREIDLHHLRTNIGVVPQENFLFSGTVRENIAIAAPGATMSRIVRAAQLAGAEEFIERMPRGYDTRLEEGASNLSGGQRQRLALARALILEPPVLILDEATSALDAESEAIINANLAKIAMERTIICVSHRLSMLVPASAILVMERGRVYDIGRHEELLHRCDIYKHMWYQQNRHMDPSQNNDPYLISSSFS